ncbi:recombinase family protein [Leptothoe sp. EHU-05/26/07-4]
MQQFGYIRVSTSKEEQLTSLKNQHQMMIDAGVPEENIFIDHGVSGWKKIKRRGFEACLNACRNAAKSDEVTLFISNDKRFGRLAAQGMLQLEELETKGVRVFDLLTRSYMSVKGDHFLVTGLKLIVGQQESQRLSEMQLRNYEQRRAQGKAMGGKPPAGYRRNPEDKGRYEVIPEFREPLKELIQWAADGVSLYQIAKRIQADDVLSEIFKKRQGANPQLPRETTLRTWLQNPVLRGHFFYKQKGVIVHKAYDCHEAIMSDIQYRAIQYHYQANQENLARWGGRKHPISSSYLRCGICGGKCCIQYSAGNKPWGRKYGRCRKENNCDHRAGTRIQIIEQAIQQKLASQASDIAKLVVQPKTDEIAQQRVVALERELDEAKAMALRSSRKGAQAMVDEIEAELRAARHQAQQTQPVDLDAYKHYLDLLRESDTLDYLDVNERHEVYYALVDKVVILDGGVSEVITIWG